MLEVRVATAQDRGAAAHALATAFAADPVVRWLMPTPRRDALMFQALAGYLYAAPGCTDLALDDGETVGVALWDPPGRSLSPRQGLIGSTILLCAMRRGIRRVVALESAFAQARPAGRFWYLAQIGATTPGRGVGSALLEHRLAGIDGPAYLESSNRRNIPLYERFGFTVTQEIPLPQGGPTLWGMARN